jgi:penicillin-binding protein 2
VRSGWRFAVLGLVFTALFGVLILRLWSLQVTASAAYVERAERQQVEVVDTPSPRGEILDRNGRVLAGTRTELAVVVNRKLIPADAEDAVVQQLAAVLQMPPADIRRSFEETGSTERFILTQGVDADVAIFVAEHAESFPGIAVEPQPVRVYPEGETAAHIVGYLGAPDAADLERPDVAPSDKVGKAGVEREYDSLLRGDLGKIKYRINSRGEILGVLGEQPPVPGGTVYLATDVEIQQALERSLQDGLELAIEQGEPAIRAVGVVIDPNNGDVLAMASNPTFDPNIFIDGLTQSEWEALLEYAVFNNFAIQGLFPPASAFKTVAYVMAMEEEIFPEGIESADEQYLAEETLEFRFQDGSPQVFHDWKEGGHGLVDLHEALQVSADVYFWEVALTIWRNRNNPDIPIDEALLQNWARQFGFGAETGIDLPFEQDGLIPDREWFETVQKETPGRVRDTPWAGGDLMNTVIGQGEVLVTPLQLANAYAAMVNGGTVYRPRVVTRVEDGDGNPLYVNPPTEENTVDLDPETVAALREALQQVVNGPRGTARTAFSDFGEGVELVGGKTGTAQIVIRDEINTAWFVGVAPIDDPEYVVAIVVDRGGSGGRIAAPIARQMLQFLMNGPDGVTPLVAGAEAD